MKKVRFLTDLYDLETCKFYTFNDVAEFSDKRANDLFEKGCVDILKEEKKAVKKPKAKKETKKEDKETKVDKK